MLGNNKIKSTKNFIKKVLVFLCIITFSKSWGQTILAWDFESGTSSNVNLPGGSTTISSSGITIATTACNGTNGYGGSGWNVGDYIQILAPTSGYAIGTLTFNVRCSNTGPANFKVQYSSTGTAGPFIDFATFVCSNASSCNAKSVDFSSVSALNCNANVVIRLVFTGGEADGSPATGDAASGGTFRMDDVILTGTSTSCSGTYTITYNGNGNTGGSVPVDGTSYASGTSVTVLGNTGSLVKSGCYIFDGWATTAGGAVAYTAGQTFAITANTNLYAHWTSTSFAVTFNNNGGSGSMSNQSNCVAVNLNSNTFTKSCATFAGWNTASNGSGTAYADNASYNFTANTTLYAQWTSTSHTVIFNNNGGSGSMSNQTACVSTALTSNAFTKSGCLFTGWNTAADGSGTAYSNNATYSFSSDISLYAQWDCSICINEDFESGLPTGGYSTGSWALTSGVWTGTNVIRGTVPHSGSYDC